MKEVSMLCTKVLTIDNKLIIVPNSEAPFVRVSGYTDYAVVYTIRVWTKSANYWDCYFDLMQKVGEFKDKNGIVGGVPSMRYISDR